MGKSIRSKRMKKLRTIKREKLIPRETILLEQRDAVTRIIRGEKVDESKIPQLPEDVNAPVRFQHTRDGAPVRKLTLAERYGHLAKQNTCVTKFNTLEALRERYGDKEPCVKKETPEAVASSAFVKRGAKAAAKEPEERTLPSTLTRRRRSGRDRTEKTITGSVKQEGDASMQDVSAMATSAAAAAGGEEMPDEDDVDRDHIKYGEFGKPAHERRSLARSKLSRKRSKSKGKNGFLNWHNMAASS